jgi:hypothetical protein
MLTSPPRLFFWLVIIMHMTGRMGVVWASAMLHRWAYLEAQVAFLWDPAGVAEAPARPAYDGEKRYSPVDGRVEEYFSAVTRRGRQLLSLAFTLCFVGLVIGMVISITSVEDEVKDHGGGVSEAETSPSLTEGGGGGLSAWDRFVLRYLPLVLNVVVVEVAKFIYHRCAFILTEYENYRTATEHNEALFIKLICFDFVDDYFPPFFIAFAKRNCNFHGGQCTDELGVQVALLIIFNNTTMRLLSSVVLPKAAVWAHKKMHAVSAKDEEKFDAIEKQFASQLRTLLF